MKRKIILSIALVLSITILSLTSSDRAAQAQNQTRVVADTGFVPLVPGQMLRLTVVSPRDPVSGQAAGKFRRIDYTQGVCNGGVCKHAVLSENTSPSIMLESNEAVSFDITPMPNSSGVRGVIVSNSRDLRVNALIIETVSGNVVSYWFLPDYQFPG